MAEKSNAKTPALITDGCSPELVEGARFDGIFEIPVIERPEVIEVPAHLVPFSKRDRVDPKRFAVCAYENDVNFADLLRDPAAYVGELKKYQAVISPDASLFWDAPLAVQVANTYRNHAVGSFLQRQGVSVIPNVRWGDERTYTAEFLPEPLAFLGVEKHAIVSIGTYGVIKTADEKRHMKAGLAAMLRYLEPEVVLVYGSMPDDIFAKHRRDVEFVQYQDWTSYIKEITPDKPKPEGEPRG